MRGVEIEVSLHYFLKNCGLEAGKIKLLNAYRSTNLNQSDVFVLMLYGDDEQLPKVEDGECFPIGQIVMTESPFTHKITGKIVVNK